jgi:holliday junction DNA helicase RuvA
LYFRAGKICFQEIQRLFGYFWLQISNKRLASIQKNLSMIDYIKGVVATKTPTYVVLETSNGVAYRINISLNTFSRIEYSEDAVRVRLFTYLQIREDAHILYGFADESERAIFILLLSVSGVGAATAQVLLSGMSPDDVRQAVLSENEVAFGRVKGIGPKTAKRIILDLKDKVRKESPFEAGAGVLNLPTAGNTAREEALSALVSLGFQRIAAQKVLNALLKDKPDAKVEELIRMALKQLSA